MEEQIPEKGSLEYIKYKRKIYNKQYQDKLKRKIHKDDVEIIDPPEEFFFQPEMKKPPQAPAEKQQIILKMPETSIMTQVKNQLIMGALAIIPILLTSLFKKYEKAQNNTSPSQSSTQSNQPSIVDQQLNFF